MTANWPTTPGCTKVTAQAASINAARPTVAHSPRAMPHTAWATTATATTLRPCTNPAGMPSPPAENPRPNNASAKADGSVKPYPSRQRTTPATTHQPQRHTHLAAGRARQELAQRHQVCVAVLREPTAAHHKFITEIAQVGHRPAKRGQPQAQEHPEHLPGSGRCNGGRGRTWCDRHGA